MIRVAERAVDAANRAAQEHMRRICANCGFVFGQHRTADNACPLRDANGEWAGFPTIQTFAAATDAALESAGQLTLEAQTQ